MFNVCLFILSFSKRYQLDSKVSKYHSLLERVFYLLKEQRLQEAYEMIKKKGAMGRPLNVYAKSSSQAMYEKCSLHNQWKDLITAYTGVIAYMLWYRTGSEASNKSKPFSGKAYFRSYFELLYLSLECLKRNLVRFDRESLYVGLTSTSTGLYFIKVKSILSLKFKNNLIFHFIKELKKNRFLNSFIK